jgi:carbamoyl-phosphate synthase large subunit
VTVKNARLTALGVKVAGLLPYFGAMDIDLFLRDREPCVIDVNPRFGGAYPCAHLAGADFTGKILRMLKGERLAPDLDGYRAGVRMMKASAFRSGTPPVEPGPRA